MKAGMLKAYDGLLKAFEYLLFICFAVLVTVVFSNVFCRFILSHSLPWAEELARFLFVWITFIGAVLVNDKFAHMRLDLLCTSLRKPFSTLLELVVAVLAALVMLIMLRGGYSMMVDNMDYHSPAMEIPYGFVNGVIPFCCAIMATQALVRCVVLAASVFGSANEGAA